MMRRWFAAGCAASSGPVTISGSDTVTSNTADNSGKGGGILNICGDTLNGAGANVNDKHPVQIADEC